MGVFIGAGGVKPFDSFLFELFPVNAGQKSHIVLIRAISFTTTAKLVSVSVRATEKIKNLNIFFL
jgi:hypothetical protein